MKRRSGIRPIGALIVLVGLAWACVSMADDPSKGGGTADADARPVRRGELRPAPVQPAPERRGPVRPVPSRPEPADAARPVDTRPIRPDIGIPERPAPARERTRDRPETPHAGRVPDPVDRPGVEPVVAPGDRIDAQRTRDLFRPDARDPGIPGPTGPARGRWGIDVFDGDASDRRGGAAGIPLPERWWESGPRDSADEPTSALPPGADPGSRASGGGIWRAGDGLFGGLGRPSDSYGIGEAREQAGSVSDLNPWNCPDATRQAADRSQAMADLLDAASTASSRSGVGTLGLSQVLKLYGAALSAVAEEQNERADQLEEAAAAAADDGEQPDTGGEGRQESAEEEEEDGDSDSDEDGEEDAEEPEDREDPDNDEETSGDGDMSPHPDGWWPAGDEMPTDRFGIVDEPDTSVPADDGRVGGDGDEERESAHAPRPELDAEAEVAGRAEQVGDRRERGHVEIILPEDTLRGDPHGGEPGGR